MTDIVDFLTARLAADEAAAEAAIAGPVEERCASGADFGPALNRLLFHQSFNPARVLAEVKAKRAILAEHKHVPAVQREDSQGDNFGCRTCHNDWHCSETMALGWCETVRHLAAPHDQHPDYNPAWRVE